MTPRKQKNGRVVPSPEPLRVANPPAAGIDVHAAVHWVPGSLPALCRVGKYAEWRKRAGG